MVCAGKSIELKEADPSTVIHLINVGGADADPITAETDWEQRLLKNPAPEGQPEAGIPGTEVHAPPQTGGQDQPRSAGHHRQPARAQPKCARRSFRLIEPEPTLLSSLEKQQISDEVLDEVFGLGPLEPLLQDPTISDILVNTPQTGLCRTAAACWN